MSPEGLTCTLPSTMATLPSTMATPSAPCPSSACREEREHLLTQHLRQQRSLREIVTLFDSMFAEATAGLVTAVLEEFDEEGMEEEDRLDLVNVMKGQVEAMGREVVASAGHLGQREAVQAAMGGRAFTREEMEGAREQHGRWAIGGII